jgi:hypothetical protein
VKRLTTAIAVVLMMAFFAGQVWSADDKKATAPAESQKRTSIFEYKTDLNLSDAQIKKMKDVLDELNKDNRILQAKRTLADADLQSLLDKEADIQEIKAKLREISDLAITARIADIEAARKINAVMSASQLKKWREIQAAARNK